MLKLKNQSMIIALANLLFMKHINKSRGWASIIKRFLYPVCRKLLARYYSKEGAASVFIVISGWASLVEAKADKLEFVIQGVVMVAGYRGLLDIDHTFPCVNVHPLCSPYTIRPYTVNQILYIHIYATKRR